ncbi:DinB family protein [Flavobacterium sp.]|uniref:DinB family protein n=1 Tax=Flavobacterium sp. TaxID=239 RepID=UPI00120215D4|nr:DinB family protein [Flavobacterium sp.]RZJ73108.1 MAG: damage-inducible protein DinB [Flavobacterium sp.]
MKDYFLQLAEYNAWANNRAIGWITQISDEQWERKLESSFGSIRETVIHIASAEKIWVDFWAITPEPVYLSSWFNGTKEELIAIWQKASADLKKNVENQPDDKFGQEVNFVYSHGGTGQMPFWQTFGHIINHSTYHRGQLVTLLRTSGFVRLGNTDLATHYLTNYNAKI